jgi:hypothetical protein
MATTTPPPTLRCLVGSTCGRGPCEACGLVAELHVAERFVASRCGRWRLDLDTLTICRACAERPEPARAA